MRPTLAGQVHQFQVLGERLALDVASGSLHVVDALGSELIAQYPAPPGPELVARYGPEAVSRASGELADLVTAGLLFTPDPPFDRVLPLRPVRALCLNIAHDCDLACGYCFAGRGEFGGPRQLMPAATARAALDFLVSQPRSGPALEIDFFGGEPLLNLRTMRAATEYARSLEARTGKRFSFTVTTNGTCLGPAVRDYLNNEGYSVVLSLDGRPAVHDRFRRTRAGEGTYHRLVGPMLRLAQDRTAPAYCVRGTYTRHNLDFTADVAHLLELGFTSVSLEPVVAHPQEDYALREEDIPVVAAEYERLAAFYLERARAGRQFAFFHFELALESGPCLPKRLTGCGAGVEYLAVTPDGSLYPCHQLAGNPEYQMGTLDRGIERPDLAREFAAAHALAKPECAVCWARYHCGGGCHANAIAFNRDIRRPYSLGCSLQRKRLECALYVQAQLALDGAGEEV